MPKASHGYGGKFGVQQDRMDKVREAVRPVQSIKDTNSVCCRFVFLLIDW